MFCPLMPKQLIEIEPNYKNHFCKQIKTTLAECVGPDCAWWVVKERMCAITNIYFVLNNERENHENVPC